MPTLLMVAWFTNQPTNQPRHRYHQNQPPPRAATSLIHYLTYLAAGALGGLAYALTNWFFKRDRG